VRRRRNRRRRVCLAGIGRLLVTCSALLAQGPLKGLDAIKPPCKAPGFSKQAGSSFAVLQRSIQGAYDLDGGNRMRPALSSPRWEIAASPSFSNMQRKPNPPNQSSSFVTMSSNP
jgi:hypothetical protein